MQQPFPKRTDSQATGEIGVNIVSLKVRIELGWEFRRTPQESDFGIDGYIDVVTEDGHVTGKSLAVQIKTGASYFKPGPDEWHWRYDGELKHLNYYYNHPSPVLLFLVDPNSSQVWWRRFVVYETEKSGSGWTTEIPKANLLNRDSKRPLEFIVGSAEDYLDHMKEVWTLGENANKYDIIYIKVLRDEIDLHYVGAFTRAMRRLIASREVVLHSNNKVDFCIEGYDEDPRELYEIPEVRRWVQDATSELNELAYLLILDDHAQGILVIAGCLGEARKLDDQRSVITNPRAVLDFMLQQFRGLNKLTERFGIERMNKSISIMFSNKIMSLLGQSGSDAGR